MIKYLFVYGTLLPDRVPPELAATVGGLRKVGTGHTRGHLFDFGEYPGAIFGRSTRQIVRGLVYELPPKPEVLQDLDAYEGFDRSRPENSLFVRKKRIVTLRNRRKLLSWVYEYNGDPGTGIPVPGGRYSGRASARRLTRTA
jgi:gamma-glutamylcyclotransferase (GGCT)/AIG2-like uncharacterized protein YtfP